MKILFVGPYRQKDSWGKTSVNYIKALRSKPENSIACRPIYYTNNTVATVDNDILESENTFYDDYDILIQKALPHNLFIGSCKKNIAIINVETGGWTHSRARLLLNRLDEIYVSTSIEKKWLQSSNISTPVTVVSQPVAAEFIMANQKHTITLPSLLNGMFKFYCIVDTNNERSNLDILIKAFHLAFGQLDRVALILKTSSESSTFDSRRLLQEECESIKRTLNINNHYKNEFIIAQDISEKDMIGLHNSCNCFLNLHSGSNFCPETLTALYLGKTPIVMNNSGLIDMIDEKNGFVIKSEKVPVSLKNRPLHSEYDIFTANEYWYKPSIFSLIDAMRKVYHMYKNDRQSYNIKKMAAEDVLKNYTYQAIGQKLCN